MRPPRRGRVVIFLGVMGLYLSCLQLRAEVRRRALGEGGQESLTTIEAGTTGFNVSSPVLGVILLAISLMLFCLYLVHVYPIDEIL